MEVKVRELIRHRIKELEEPYGCRNYFDYDDGYIKGRVEALLEVLNLIDKEDLEKSCN